MTTMPVSADILHGAGAVAEFLYGSRAEQKKVYNLVENGALPVFRMGKTVCARRSTLLSWMEAQEKQPQKKARR